MDRLRALQPAQGRALLLTHGPHVRWACGFTGSNGWLVVQSGGTLLLTDGRYRDQAARETPPEVEVHVTAGPLVEALAPALGAVDVVAIQDRYLSLADARLMGAALPGVELVSAEYAVERLVAVKAQAEVDHIVRAQRVSEAVLQSVLPGVQAGQSEREIAAELVYGCMKRGASRMAFEPIVASGPNSALPHARPTDRLLQDGEPLLIDFGCVVDGYASDMTRMAHLGEPSAEFAGAYQAVLDAQREAIRQARGDVHAASLDAAARGVLAQRGLGDAFSHGLGHGIGLETHEWPRLSAQSDYLLPLGSVVTVEPGIYLPGQFGIRIEDLIWLREDGCHNLTQMPTDLVVL
jgi:Xaa-Pro aminopeptidase